MPTCGSQSFHPSLISTLCLQDPNGPLTCNKGRGDVGWGIQEISEVAGWGDAQLEFARDRISDEGRAEDLNKGKAPAQVALDQAAFLLDVASAEGSWDKSRQRLAELYEEGGLPQIAAFVRAGSQ